VDGNRRPPPEKIRSRKPPSFIARRFTEKRHIYRGFLVAAALLKTAAAIPGRAQNFNIY
jgi:hypothetical protein